MPGLGSKTAAVKIIKTENPAPVEPTRDMFDCDEIFNEAHAIWKKDLAEWKAEQEEAALMEAAAHENDNGPGPGVG